MKHICFVLNKFIYGGIEKVALNYLNHIDYERYIVDVFVLSVNEDIIKEIPKQCNIYILNLNYYALPESRASMMNKKTAGALIYYPTFLLKKALLPYYLLKYNKYTLQWIN
ncbi:MAG: hypothetical protein RR524_04600 [Erysipelotrichaceae bacterium]